MTNVHLIDLGSEDSIGGVQFVSPIQAWRGKKVLIDVCLRFRRSESRRISCAKEGPPKVIHLNLTISFDVYIFRFGMMSEKTRVV
jgi:hypothetical protein